jgi:hypothetical protein
MRLLFLDAVIASEAWQSGFSNFLFLPEGRVSQNRLRKMVFTSFCRGDPGFFCKVHPLLHGGAYSMMLHTASTLRSRKVRSNRPYGKTPNIDPSQPKLRMIRI